MARDNLGAPMLHGLNNDGTLVVPIAGEAQWQLRYVERHNGLVALAIKKLVAQHHLENEEEFQGLVAAAFGAKNRLSGKQKTQPDGVLSSSDGGEGLLDGSAPPAGGGQRRERSVGM